ncbi:MAG TPA: toprim domain-containing protein, partial [Thermomicrobiales bacterium]|nr:toprim domain-containing protein [Thermomicrobiales bacterium]
SLDGTRRVLYRLPEIVAADPGQRVVVVEGEKDADALAALGIVATTCAQGAGAWRDEYSASLAGRHVAIVPDNDDAGRRHAEQVARSLAGVAASVRVV